MPGEAEALVHEVVVQDLTGTNKDDAPVAHEALEEIETRTAVEGMVCAKSSQKKNTHYDNRLCI